MTLVSDLGQKSNIKESVIAAVMVLALQFLRELGMSVLPVTAKAICEQLGVSRSQAYAMRDRLAAACEDLDETPGPVPGTISSDAMFSVAAAVRDFAFENPGCVADRGARRRYSDGFRRLVGGLFAPGQVGEGLTTEQLAQATGVPLGTIKQWLRGDAAKDAEPEDEQPERDSGSTDELTSNPDIATIITEYESWRGDFSSFCDHLRDNFRLPYGRTFVSSVLQALGLRTPKRRKQPGCAPWSPGTFRSLFPGAQWLGDGTTLVMTVNGERFPFTLEAIADVSSDALVGLEVTDVEDQQAVLGAFEHGVDTTGAHPDSMTLDNKPCNHTSQIREAVEPTVVIPATPGRGQAKAPLEGKFGLFEQTAPPLVVNGSTRRELARSILILVVTLWAWTRNGKPRKRLEGRSPAHFYASYKPTPEELAEARTWIAALMRRAEKARATAERRAGPVRRQLLAQALQELEIADPDGTLSLALARYSTEAIIRGIAIFRAKHEQQTLPRDADPGRYLGGIIRNIDSDLELAAMADHLMQLRLRHRQLTLEPLQRELSRLRDQHSSHDLPFVLVRRALDVKAQIDFRFFSRQARDALAQLGQNATPILPHLLRVIAAHFGATKKRRESLIAELSQVIQVAA